MAPPDDDLLPPPSGSGSSSTPPTAAPPPRISKQRSRTSPPPGERDHSLSNVSSTTVVNNGNNNASSTSDSRPPAKRARKAVNCEACRASKLKCDRNRPCSSCVLRGTTAQCYPESRGHDGSPAQVRGLAIDPSNSHIDPAHEIAKLRQSIALLEAYIFPNRPYLTQSVHQRPSEPPATPVYPKTEAEADGADKAPPGMLGSKDLAGRYAGPTSTNSYIASAQGENRNSEDSASERHPSQEQMTLALDLPTAHDYDRDLLEKLPPIETIDQLVDFYFEFCNWIYRHVNQPAFVDAWARYKAGQFPDRVVFCTVCVLMAVAVHYLPKDHPIFVQQGGDHEELGDKWYEIMRAALQRHQAETRAYTIDLMEMYLIRSHYLYLAKKDSEEIWSLKGEIVTLAVAMGLHRDPGRWKMPLVQAERRRWAWWHTILLERWQAFLFGRPISIASHAFDTELPKFCDPAVDKTGRLYLPNIALFRLAYVLGDIMDDAVSLRPVPYENVVRNERALSDWQENLPQELDLDEYRVARSLASPVPAVRRLGVQSVIIRTSFLHIRFTLHRPYATVRAGKLEPAPKYAQSLDVAVGSADKLISMVQHAQPDFFNNAQLAVPGHMNWGPFHVFSASMFFSFQLIANPDQPGATLFRANIRKAMQTLEMADGMLPLATKAINILNALAPLYAPDFLSKSSREREKLKASVLNKVKNLAFPYHDSPLHTRGSLDSPMARQASSPANSSSLSPQNLDMILPHQHQQHPPPSYQQVPDGQTHSLPPMSAMRSAPPPGGPGPLPSLAPYTHPPPLPPPHLQGQPPSASPVSPTGPPAQHHMQSFQQGSSTAPPYGYPMNQAPMYADGARYGGYSHADEELLFGASVGMAGAEWTWFRDYTQRPDQPRPPT